MRWTRWKRWTCRLDFRVVDLVVGSDWYGIGKVVSQWLTMGIAVNEIVFGERVYSWLRTKVKSREADETASGNRHCLDHSFEVSKISSFFDGLQQPPYPL